MNFLQKTIAGIAVAVTAAAAPVEASTYYNDHVRLVQAVEQVGVDFQLNPFECFQFQNRNIYGWYYGAGQTLVVCQQNAKNSQEVAWTEEDYDTLRHEVHHMVQDCMDGLLQGRLESVYQEPVVLAKDVLGYDMIMRILRGYSDLDEHRQLMELEAFAVAHMSDPDEQIEDIQRYCM